LGTLTAGSIAGTLDAGQIDTLSAQQAPVTQGSSFTALKVKEGGVTRTVTLAAAPGGALPSTIGYYYDSTLGNGAPPRVTLQVGPSSGAYDVIVTTDTTAGKTNLAALYALGTSPIRNVAVEGDLTPDASHAAYFGLPTGTAGGIQLPT